MPTSTFNDSCEMRIAKTESILKKPLQKEVSAKGINKDKTTFIVPLLVPRHSMLLSSHLTLVQFVTVALNRSYIELLLEANDVYLVFDPCKKFSSKGVVRINILNS